jgi:hypothetical protein
MGALIHCAVQPQEATSAKLLGKVYTMLALESL